RDLPRPLQRRPGVGGERDRSPLRLVPRHPEIVAGGDARPEVRATHPGEQAGCPPPLVDRHRVHLVHGEVRARDAPGAPVIVAAGQIQPLIRADGEHCRHRCLPSRQTGPPGRLRPGGAPPTASPARRRVCAMGTTSGATSGATSPPRPAAKPATAPRAPHTFANTAPSRERETTTTPKLRRAAGARASERDPNYAETAPGGGGGLAGWALLGTVGRC